MIQSDNFLILLGYIAFVAIFAYLRFFRYTVKAPIQLGVATAIIVVNFFAKDSPVVSSEYPLRILLFVLIAYYGYLLYKLGRRDKDRVIAWFFYLNFLLFSCFGSSVLFDLLNWRVLGWTERNSGFMVALAAGLLLLLPRIFSHIQKLKNLR